MKNIVLDKIVQIIRLKRLNNISKGISKYEDLPKSLLAHIRENNKQLLEDKRFLLNLILKVALNKQEEG